MLLMKQLMMILLVLLVSGMAVLADDVPTEYDPSVCENDNKGEELSADCLAMIEAFPKPVVEAVPRDGVTLNQYSFWKIGPNATDMYDAPNGSVVAQYPAGFNFVIAWDLSVDGWMQIQGGNWIQRSLATYTGASEFSGVILPDGIPHEFAWVLDLSRIYVSEYPGGPASEATGRWLERYELVNIFARAVDEEGWEWYMIGPNQWVKQTFVAKVHAVEPPEGVTGRWVSVDLYEQTLVAYEDDIPVFATLVASGIPPYDTPEGLFSVWAELEADDMSGATGAPEAYALQSVPWVLYFNEGFSLHGTYWHNLFGYRQSHGCVNLSISDAKWLFRWFEGAEPNETDEDDNPITVKYVHVYSSGEYGGGVIRQSPNES